MINCALSLLIIATCIVGTFADEFYEKQKNWIRNAQNIAIRSDAEIIELNSNITKLVVFEERERKSLEEGTKCNELNTKLADLQNKLGVYEERERKINDKFIKLHEKLAVYEYRESKSLEEGNMCNELNATLAELPRILLNLQEREKRGIEEMNKSKQLNEQLGEVQENLVRLSNLEKAKEDLEKRLISPQTNCTIYASPGVDTQRFIEIEGMEAFPVRCVNDLNSGPGWMLIQKRMERHNHFYKYWYEYRDGFSYDNGGLFIGLEKLYRLTNLVPHELYIDMEDWDGNKEFAHYDNFRVGNESEQYPLKDLGNYTLDSNAGDALRDNNNMKFSTIDRDNDNSPHVDCVTMYYSGWWHNNCTKANLNGYQYGTNKYEEDGIWWHSHVQL